MATPRTVWRTTLRDGAVGHCVLWERKPGTTVAWYRDEELLGAEEFPNVTAAEDRASSLRAELLGSSGGRFH